MDCSTPDFSVLYYLPEFAQINVHWVADAIQLSHPLLSPSPPASESFPKNWLFVSGGQSIGASASVLPMNIQGWFPLGLTGLISLPFKELSSLLFTILSNYVLEKTLESSKWFEYANMDLKIKLTPFLFKIHEELYIPIKIQTTQLKMGKIFEQTFF